MKKVLKIAVIGDFDKKRSSHPATEKALYSAATKFALDLDVQWIPTNYLEDPQCLKKLQKFNGIWGAPGLVRSSLGFINGIQIARQEKIPYLGT